MLPATLPARFDVSPKNTTSLPGNTPGESPSQDNVNPPGATTDLLPTPKVQPIVLRRIPFPVRNQELTLRESSIL